MCKILIVNISENKEGFEDSFCERVVTELSVPVDYRALRAEQMLSYDFGNTLDHNLIVLVGHGRRKGSYVTGTAVVYSGVSDIGDLVLPDETYDYLDEPDKLLTCFLPNDKPFLLILWVCESMSISTLEACALAGNCRGLIAPIGKPKFCECIILIKTIDYTYSQITQGQYSVSNTELRKLSSSLGGDLNLTFMPVIEACQ